MPMSSDFQRRLGPVLGILVERYGTPFHIYDAEGIVSTHREMCRAFRSVGFRQYYAVKALPNPAVLSLLLAEGSGLDCSSPSELELAARVGASADDVVFTSNNTTPEEYAMALEAGAIVTFDDVTALDKARRLPDVVAFRVAPGGPAGSVQMGSGAGSKFGVPRDVLAEAYGRALARGARRFGIHGMACANELDTERAAAAAEDLLGLAAEVAGRVGIRFEYVNIGGGLGIPYRPEDRPVDYARYAGAVAGAAMRLFGPSPPRIISECGRYVTGPHGVLVTRVVNRCEKGRLVVGLDASMPALMRPGLYAHAYHHASIPGAEGREPRRADLVGSLCENMDKFAVDRVLPDPREGDVVLIHDTGAHGHAMGFNYNGRLRPAELLLLAEGKVVEIRRAETFDDLTATVNWAPRPVALAREGQGAS